MNKILLVRHEPYGTTTFTNKQLNEEPSDPIVPLGVASALVQLGQTSVKWAWGPSRVASLRRHVLKILRNPNLKPLVLFIYSYHFISHFSFSYEKTSHHLNLPSSPSGKYSACGPGRSPRFKRLKALRRLLASIVLMGSYVDKGANRTIRSFQTGNERMWM